MKTADQMIAALLRRIANILQHERPLMYARTPEELDSVLFNYLQLWAEFTERQEDFDKLARSGNALGFATPYARNHVDAPPEQVAQHVVRKWRAGTKRLKIKLPSTTPR